VASHGGEPIPDTYSVTENSKEDDFDSPLLVDDSDDNSDDGNDCEPEPVVDKIRNGLILERRLPPHFVTIIILITLTVNL